MNNNILGIDIGATKTIFLVVQFLEEEKFEVLEECRVETPRTEKDILNLMEAKAREFIGKYDIKALGIGFAGPVDFERGIALIGPNIGTGAVEFKKVLEEKLSPLSKIAEKKFPVVVDNDARCFVLAESAFGAAKGNKNIVGITIGTGIGGGIIIDGKIYRGAGGSAGEFGHTNIEKGREWEKISSGTGLANIYKQITGRKADGFKIISLAKNGDEDVLKTVETVAENLGTGLANILEVINPEIIVLGGGLSEENIFIDAAKKYIKEKVFLPSLANTPIIKGSLGESAIALGAAWMGNQASE